MTPEPAQVPRRLIALNERVLPRPDEPITADDQVAATHLIDLDVPSAQNLLHMFGQSTLQRCVQSFPCVDDTTPSVKGVDALLRRGDILAQWVCRAHLEFLYELMSKGLIELEVEIMLIAHGC